VEGALDAPGNRTGRSLAAAAQHFSRSLPMGIHVSETNFVCRLLRDLLPAAIHTSASSLVAEGAPCA
jgi:hypothetical protein